MAEYTPEQIDACILAYKAGDLNYCRAGIIDLLTAYATILRQQAGRVDEGMVDRYLAAQKETICRLDRQWGTSAGGSDFVREACRAGLTAALAQNTQVAGCSLGCKDGQCLAQDHGCPSECVKPKAAQNTQGYGEAVAWLHTVTQGDGETDQALSFSRDSFPLDTQLGFRSLGAVPLYLHAERARVPNGYLRSQHDAMDAAAKWWQLAQENGVTGAVKWLRNDETGSVVVYTRGEYADRLIGFVCSLDAAPSQRAEVDRG